MTLNPSHGDSNRNDSNAPPDYVSAFVRQYKQEYGFVIEVNENNNNNNSEEPQVLSIIKSLSISLKLYSFRSISVKPNLKINQSI